MACPCLPVPCLQGYIYVEAEKASHVKDAIRGLRTMFSSKGVKLVPLSEMVDAITVNRKAKELLGGRSWEGGPPPAGPPCLQAPAPASQPLALLSCA